MKLKGKTLGASLGMRPTHDYQPLLELGGPTDNFTRKWFKEKIGN